MFHPRMIFEQPIKDGVTLRIKQFYKGPVWYGREEMSADLCLLVVRHAHVEAVSQPGKPFPFGGSPAPAGVKIAEVDRLTHDQIPAPPGADFTLSSRDGNPGRFSDKLHSQLVTFPLARFFKPKEVDVFLLGQQPEAYRLSRRPILVRINRHDEIGTCRRRCDF